MAIKLVRVDDRLIHGQITTGWVRSTGSNLIVVADDDAAADSMQKNLMKMAVPPGVSAEILFVKETGEKLIDDEWSNKNILLIVRGPIQLLDLVEQGVDIQHVNVGNAGGGEGKTKLTKQVAATPDELEAWKALDQKDIDLEVQWRPGDKRTDLNKIVQKKT